MKDNEKANIGLNIEDIEKVVHGDDPAHDEESVPGKKITMQDILKLGLSEEMLKGGLWGGGEGGVARSVKGSISRLIQNTLNRPEQICRYY